MSVRACPCCVQKRIEIPQHAGEADTNPVPVTRAPSWVHAHWAACFLPANSYLYLLSIYNLGGVCNDIYLLLDDASKICCSNGQMLSAGILLANSERRNANKPTAPAALLKETD